MPESLVRVDSVTKRFGSVEALANLSVDLAPGAIGLVGPNGSGKTTLLRLLLGLIRPDSGRLSVLGHDTENEPLRVRELVGYMPEHDCLIPDMSGIGFVAYMARVSGLPREFAMSRAHDVLEFVGLAEQRYRKISEYSVGMRQRIKLAQALVHDPPVCFLDEPTSGLDPKGRAEMLDLLRALARVGRHSFVLSTHLLPDADGLCDQVLLLSGGRRLAAGPVASLVSQHEARTLIRIRGDVDRFVAALRAKGVEGRVRDGAVEATLPGEDSRPVFAAALEVGAQVRHLGRSVRTIEDLFLERVESPAAPEAP